NLIAFAYRVFQPEPDPAVIAREAAALLQSLDPPPDDRPPDSPPALVTLAGLLLPAFTAARNPRSHPGQAAVLRCVAGNPFRRTRFRRDWRTSSVLAVAAGIAA